MARPAAAAPQLIMFTHKSAQSAHPPTHPLVRHLHMRAEVQALTPSTTQRLSLSCIFRDSLPRRRLSCCRYPAATQRVGSRFFCRGLVTGTPSKECPLSTLSTPCGRHTTRTSRCERQLFRGAFGSGLCTSSAAHYRRGAVAERSIAFSALKCD